MNNLLRSAARKHAMSMGIMTSGWTDGDFEEYVANNGITERDNLKPKAKARKAAEPKAEAPKAEAPKGGVEAAIADLVASIATQPQGVDEAAVIALIEKHSLAPRETVVSIQQDGKTVAKIEGAHKDTGTIMGHIAAGVNIAVVGPAGSGKSTIFSQVAESLGLSYYIVGAVQTESKVLGYMDATGNYVRTPFRDAYEHGGLFVVEEFDGSHPRALLAINNATANEYTDFPDGMVKRHPDFVIAMAGNTYGTGASREYCGRTQIDSATLDRFCFLEVGYDEVLERNITLAINESAGDWVSEVQGFRAKVAAAGIRFVVSPRASIAGAKLLKQGLPIDIVRETALYKSLSEDQRKQLGI